MAMGRIEGGYCMRKVAVLVYDQFCNFEFSVALEMLAMAFGKALGIEVYPKSFEAEIN
jgi:hypothetical protein